MSVHFSDSGVQSLLRAADVVERDDLRTLFWMEMLEQGFWINRRGSIALVLGTPQSELDRFEKCVKSFLEKYAALVRVE
jgi:glutamate-1-semialdehyde 2,1-aminomutase